MKIIAIAGGSGSGKSFMSQKIVANIGKNVSPVLCVDSYYKNRIDLPLEERKKLNFDHSSMLDVELLCAHLSELKRGNAINVPVYSYVTCSRTGETQKIYPEKVLIVEGLFALTNSSVRSYFDYSVYLFKSSKERLNNILMRDAQSRARNKEEIIERFERMVNPMHELFIEPSKKHADVIINTRSNTERTLEFITNKTLLFSEGK